MTSCRSIPANRAGMYRGGWLKSASMFKQQVVVVGHGVPHRGDDGGAEAELAGPVQGLDPRVVRGQFVDHAAGPVRRVVVDDQDVGLGGVAMDLLDQPGNIVALVVRGHGDEQPVGRSCLHPGGLPALC